MKKIKLANNGGFALVDDDDYEELSKYRWYNGHGYAVRSNYTDGLQKQIRMHRVIMRAIGTSDYIDHRNHDTLDNRRRNLRVCDNRLNQGNAVKRLGTSAYRGVSRMKNGKWVAQIRDNWKKRYLGCFNSDKEAARTYNHWAVKIFGQFANINKLEEE